jgi:hypothetical protein
MRLDELARSIQSQAERALGVEVSAKFGDGVDFFDEPFCVSNERLRSMGWGPRGSIEGDIRETIDFFRGQEVR